LHPPHPTNAQAEEPRKTSPKAKPRTRTTKSQTTPGEADRGRQGHPPPKPTQPGQPQNRGKPPRTTAGETAKAKAKVMGGRPTPAIAPLACVRRACRHPS